jgi:peptidoglycan hydrolase-like protein with peptidoglycan-binding domain
VHLRSGRARWGAVIGAAVLALLVAGWAAASAVQSPKQREADARPPARGPILEAVRRGVLNDVATAKGSIGYSNQSPVSAINLPARAVVTGVGAKLGDSVGPGDVPVVINGRPLVLLPGVFPFYRDLVPGAEGPDVAQLQDALAATGHPVRSTERGVFGVGTAEAVRKLYRDTGFTLPSAPASSDGAGPVFVPLAEVAVVGTLPAVATSLPAVGATLQPDSDVLVVSSGALVATASLPAPVAVRTSAGLTATISRDDGKSEPGKVVAVTRDAGSSVAEGGASLSRVVVELSGRLTSDWLGADVLVTINFTPPSQAGLIVPSRAVTFSSNGTARVSRARGQSDNLVRVEVREVQVLGGESLVEPQRADDLRAGDRVRVG